MAKIKLTEDELRGLIQEAISNVKSSEQPKKIKVKLSELKEVVKSVLKEYKHNPTPGFNVEADFVTTENEIPFTIVARYIKYNGEEPYLDTYGIADEDQFKQNKAVFQEIQEYLNSHYAQIGETLDEIAKQEDPEFEGDF